MNDMEFECGEELETEEPEIWQVPVEYRDPKINQATFLLAIGVMLAIMYLPPEGPYQAVAVAVGLLVAGAIIAVSEKCIRQWTVADLESGEVYRYTECFGRSWSRYLVSLDEVKEIFVNPKRNLWSQEKAYFYPVSAATFDGREIVFSNTGRCHDLNWAGPEALTLGYFLNKEVFIPTGNTPLEVTSYGSIVPKSEDVGMLGRFIALSIIGLILWGTVSVMCLPLANHSDASSASDLHDMAVLAANIEQQPVPESPVKPSKTTPPSTPAKAAEKK